MENKKAFRVGAKVQWKWLGRAIDGVVKEVHLETISMKIKGADIKRKGTEENPAYLVQSVAGNIALKLHSELQSSEGSSSAKKESAKKKSQPKMFGK